MRLADIRDFKPSLNDPRKINLTEKEQEKYSVHLGDILVVRVNGSKDIVGRLVLMLNDLDAAYCDHFIRIRVSENCNPVWLSYLGNDESFRKHIFENMVSSAGQNTVSQGTLKGYFLKLPSIDEQEEIVRRIEKSFAAIDIIAAQTAAGLHQLSNLEAHCLNKAFRGELVPQDPNDEPASALLERIRTEKASAVPAKHARKKAVKKKT